MYKDIQAAVRDSGTQGGSDEDFVFADTGMSQKSTKKPEANKESIQSNIPEARNETPESSSKPPSTIQEAINRAFESIV